MQNTGHSHSMLVTSSAQGSHQAAFVKENESINESKYIEKIKLLKAENKKLVALLRDSEKLFYQKLKETKKESENLSALFKQLWPLIKNKVKDPNGLLKTVNGLQGEETEF